MGDVVRIRQGQNLLAPGVDAFLVIVEGYGISVVIVEGITLGNGALAAHQEQGAIAAPGAGIGIGDVRHVVPAVQGDDIPHMAAAAVAGDAVAGQAAHVA